MKSLEQFTNLYKVSKTLRFELIPIGKTQENIEKNGVIEKDAALADGYKEMKKTIDEYHKAFIDRALQNAELQLDEYLRLYYASSEEKEMGNAFENAKAALRKEIVSAFKSRPEFNYLDKKELIKDLLKKWVDENPTAENGDELNYHEEFERFTTYFTGYNTNRMNMYSDEAKATSVAHRMIDENLPKFIDNIAAFDKIRKSEVAKEYPTLINELKAVTGVDDLDVVFSVPYYNRVLTQKGIDIYNTLIGGQKTESGKIKGLNEYVNLYNQTHPDSKLPKLKVLYKQILSDRGAISWLPAAFANAKEVLDNVLAFSYEYDNLTADLEKVIASLPGCDTDGVFIRESALSGISNKMFNGDYGALSRALGIANEEEKTAKKKERYLAVADIQRAIDSIADSENSDEQRSVAAWFASNIGGLIEEMAKAYAGAAPLLNSDKGEEYKLTQADKAVLKTYLDSAMDVLHFVKPLYVSADAVPEKDHVFYGSFSEIYEKMLPITSLYDMVRNFATKKPYSDEKIKLNFDCSTLLDGWDVNKEKDNLSVLFEKDGFYYLGIMAKSSNKLFENKSFDASGDCYRKVQYKLLPGPNKMLPKVFFSNKWMKDNPPSARILDIYRKGSFKKGPDFNVDDCRALIDYYKESIGKYTDWSVFGFDFSKTADYSDISEFFGEISEQGYQLTFNPIPTSYINELVDSGKLYLFKIYNKDFSSFSKGKPNLHTMYWRALFAEENLANVVYKLNGQAEVFFRKRSIPEEQTVTHRANQKIAKKNPALHGQSSTFEYDIVKDRRYTVDKFQFHVPITMNYKALGATNINQNVCDYIRDNPDVKIIGIDRGERHLLYISMIDRNGNVVNDENGGYIQYSLNTLTGSYRGADGKPVVFETPYRQLLDQKEKERDEARRNWDSIENIKELKEGYMSQVIHHIAGLMVKYNAIVVMEDLNTGFKRGRIKVEKQVYQKFEKALIDKLNYLVFKEKQAEQPGGLYKALQLTNQFDGFKNMTKQSGFLFYVPAWNTSKIDPVTGFVDMLKPKYESVGKAQEFFGKFDSIRYDRANDWFAFDFDYKNFIKETDLIRTKWTVCTHGELRYAFDKSANNNKGGYVKRNVTESLKKLFDKYGVDFASGEDVRAQIVANGEKSFFITLIKNLQITLAMRYSSSEDGKDFILSPVADANGEFYCSEGRSDGLPQDADANGAFNIARKGLMVVQMIDNAKSYKDWTTKIKNVDWLNFAQGKA